MLIETTRFGKMEIEGDRVIEFKGGLLGFPHRRRFALIQTSPDPVFYWLQSVEDPALAFVVCDPREFVPDFQAPIRRDDLRSLEIDDLSDSQVLVIVNQADGYITGNLLGPLVIGATSRLGRQLVLSDRKYGTRQRLMRVATDAVVSRSA